MRELAHELERALIFEEGGALNFAQLPGDAREITQGAERPADAAWLRPGFQFPERGFALEEAINQFIQLALALDISQMREGTLAVRLFDREGRFVTAVPPTVEPMTLPARELEMLRCLQPARRFLEAARLNEQFLVVDESLPVRETMPLLEVNIPIHARGGGNPVACRRPAACGWAPAAARIRAH